MTIEQVENILNENNIKLDVRVLNTNSFNLPNHIRLLDVYGEMVIDIYFKYSKKKQILRNTYFIHKTQFWGQIENENNLVTIINQITKNTF